MVEDTDVKVSNSQMCYPKKSFEAMSSLAHLDSLRFQSPELQLSQVLILALYKLHGILW